MISGEEAAQSIRGVMGLARFQRGTAPLFGHNLAACRRSFTVYFFALPAIALLIGAAALADESADIKVALIVGTIAALIQILGFPVLLIPLLRFYGRSERWAWLVTSYNWFNAVQMVFIVFLLGLSAGPLAGLGIWPLRGAQLYLLVVEAFLAESILEVGGLKSLIVVLLDVFFSLGVEQAAQWIS